MRATLVLIPVFGPLAVLAANVERGLERDIHDGPVAPTPDPFDGGTGLYQQWPQLGSVPVNRTVGSTRSGKRHLSSLLEARQNSVSRPLALKFAGNRPTLADLVSACNGHRCAWTPVSFSYVLPQTLIRAATQNTPFVRLNYLITKSER